MGFKYFLAILMFLGTSAVMADDIVLKWQPPTTRTDGTPLDPSEIDHYNLYQDDVFIGELTGDTHTIPNVSPGNYCFTLTTTDTDGRSGPFSDAACKLVKAPPGAPSTIVIDVVWPGKPQ